MKLAVFNGSPRGRGSTSKVLLEQFLRGFEAAAWNSHETFYLNRVRDTERFAQAFADAEHALLAFPLYWDAMPGQVKTFIEALEPLCGREGNPDVGFLVQSGFPEAAHMRPVERYLEKLASRLGCGYVGTIIKGNCNRVEERPAKANRKLFGTLLELGVEYVETGRFDEALMAELAKPERFPKLMAALFRLLENSTFMRRGWNNQIKKSGAYEDRFARPYAE